MSCIHRNHNHSSLYNTSDNTSYYTLYNTPYNTLHKPPCNTLHNTLYNTTYNTLYNTPLFIGQEILKRPRVKIALALWGGMQVNQLTEAELENVRSDEGVEGDPPLTMSIDIYTLILKYISSVIYTFSL